MARLVLYGLCLVLLAACSGVELHAEGTEHDIDWFLSIPF